MEFEQLLKIIKTVSDSSLTGFKYEENGVKISMSSEQVQIVSSQGAAPVTMPVQPFINAPVQASQAVAEVEEPTGNIVKSPLVGTFYAASSEDTDPFVTVGSQVKKGQTLAIVEAMKLMNDIECEFDGTIAEIYVENGEAVEYGQPLFRIS